MPLALPKASRITGETIELRNGGLAKLALDVALQDPDFYTFGYLQEGTDKSKMIDTQEKLSATGEASYWAMVSAVDNLIVGLAEAHVVDAEARWLELGYWVAEGQRGKGIATEALKLLTQWIETDTDATQIDLPIHPENGASMKVAERAGYTHRGQVFLERPVGGQRIAELYTWSRHEDVPVQASGPAPHD
jgi:RimJ/RimL family protein N-acetyltransferase